MNHIHFQKCERPVYQSLSRTVNDYFREKSMSRTGNQSLFTKALIIAGFYFVSYAAIFILPTHWTLVAWALHGIATALVGFNIMHDGAHESFSGSRRLNKLLAMTFNLIGSNRYYWAQKHNRNHHAFTNVDCADEDIDALGLFRMSPHQKHYPHHRFQHIYVWFLYMITTLFWFFALDFKAYIRQKIAHRNYSRRLKIRDHVEFWVSKLLYLSIYIVLPASILGASEALLGFLLMHLFLGTLFAVVFQLAHVVEKAEFPLPDSNGSIRTEWAVHQLDTTVDFATHNRFITWALGGLNFQAEHHLFPRVSHIHYPELHPIVEAKVAELGYTLKSYPTLWSALVGHYRHLRHLSQNHELIEDAETKESTYRAT